MGRVSSRKNSALNFIQRSSKGFIQYWIFAKRGEYFTCETWKGTAELLPTKGNRVRPWNLMFSNIDFAYLFCYARQFPLVREAILIFIPLSRLSESKWSATTGERHHRAHLLEVLYTPYRVKAGINTTPHRKCQCRLLYQSLSYSLFAWQLFFCLCASSKHFFFWKIILLFVRALPGSEALCAVFSANKSKV